MGFYVTLVYLVVLIITPGALFPELAQFRVQWLIAGVAVLLTAGVVPVYGYPLRTVQTLLMVAFLGQVMASRLALGWVGGAVYALTEFGSVAGVFFLLIAGRLSTSRLTWIAAALSLPALLAVCSGIGAVFFQRQPETYIMYQNVLDSNLAVSDIVERIRFHGFFSDPNDLAQYFLVCVPFLALLWKPGQQIRNLLLVVPIIAFVFFGMYLTHSRGMLVGVVVVVMAFLYDRFNKTVMAFGSAAVAVAGIGANVSGGRAISFSSGSDRIEAWSAGFGMLREHPLFGVGYNLFIDHNDMTAHYSFVLCFSELGLIGFFLWLGLLVSTLLSLNRLITRLTGKPAARDLRRWATALRLSLLSFIATGWFLSRTYSILFYVMIAMGVVIERLAAQFPGPAPTKRPWHWASTTAMVQVACLVVIYVMIRARWAQ